MKKKKLHSLEDQLYKVGLVLLIVVTIVVVILKNTLPAGFKLRACLFYQLTGYSCMGCGATRAFINLLQGNIVISFIYNPVVLYVVVLFFVFMGSHTVEKIHRLYCRFRKKSTQEDSFFIKGIKFRTWYMYGVIVVLIINFMVKNILIYMGLWQN